MYCIVMRHQNHCNTSGFFSLFSSTLSMNCFARMVNFSFSWTISVTYKNGVSFSEEGFLKSGMTGFIFNQNITTEAP